MAKDYSKNFYKSKAWQSCRKSYIGNRIHIDGGMCEHCKRKPGYIVDHVLELSPENISNPDISLSHVNLQYLCLECHNTKTFGSDIVLFDDNGDPIV